MENIHQKIKDLIADKKVVLFMKGSKEFPQCGFSAQAVHILLQTGVDFTTVDVLANPLYRQFLPEVSNWPTFPQLFINKELVGGSDIITEEFENGNLMKQLENI